MRTPLVTEEEVVTFFKEHHVVTWEQLTSHFKITKQALQRKFKNHPHLTSLNNNRRYLALEKYIGEIDKHGIWNYRGILFSIHGNTPKTLTHLIHNSDCGLSTTQLQQITTVKCWGILLKLLKRGMISRIKEGFDYVYLSSDHDVRRVQLKNRGLASQEPLVEAQTQKPSTEKGEIHNFLELKEDDYLLRRLEIVRRVKSGKNKAQVARELDCSPDTVRNTCKVFNKHGAKGLIITREKRSYKMTENVEREILVMKAKCPGWSPEKIGKELRKLSIDVSDRSVRIFMEEVGLTHLKKT